MVETRAFEDLTVGHFVTPLNAEDTVEAAHMEAVQFALLFRVHCSRFAAVEESADYAGVVHCHLGWSCQLWVLPDAGGKVT